MASRKRKAIDLDTKYQILQAVNRIDKSKTEIAKAFQICFCGESRTGYRNVLVTNILKPLEQCVFYISVLCCSHLFSAGPTLAAFVCFHDGFSHFKPNIVIHMVTHPRGDHSVISMARRKGKGIDLDTK
jgi:hypothetical protein